MSQSTPLDKLDGPASSSDANLVSKILADMNISGSDNQAKQTQAIDNPNHASLSQRAPRLVLQEPPIQSTQEYTMDSMPATAHMIGNSAPSNQDFSSMMGSMYAQVPQMNQVEPIIMPVLQKQDMWSYLAERIRAPIVVTALFFLLNLPIFQASILQFAPWAFRSGSEYSVVGLVVVSLIAGLLFAGYQLLSDIIGV
jgi:hypothetical protein